MREQRSAKEIVKILLGRIFSNTRRLLIAHIGAAAKTAAVVAAVWVVYAPLGAEAVITASPAKVSVTVTQNMKKTSEAIIISNSNGWGSIKLVNSPESPAWVTTEPLTAVNGSFSVKFLFAPGALKNGSYDGALKYEVMSYLPNAGGTIFETVTISVFMQVVPPEITYSQDSIYFTSDSSCLNFNTGTEVNLTLKNAQANADSYLRVAMLANSVGGWLNAFNRNYSWQLHLSNDIEAPMKVYVYPSSNTPGVYTGTVSIKTVDTLTHVNDNYVHTIPVTYTVNQKPVVTYSSGAFDGCDKYRINATVQPNTSCKSSYKIYFGMSPEPTTMTEISSYPDGNSKTGAEPYTVTHTFENLVVNTDYYYRVDAINGQGTTTGEVQKIAKESAPEECRCVKTEWIKDYDLDTYAFNANGMVESVLACDNPDVLHYTAASRINKDKNGIIFDCNDNDKYRTPEFGCDKILTKVHGDSQSGEICSALPIELVGGVFYGNAAFGNVTSIGIPGVDISWIITKTPHDILGNAPVGQSVKGDEITKSSEDMFKGLAIADFAFGNMRGEYEVGLFCTSCDAGSPQKYTLTAECRQVPPYKQGGDAPWANDFYANACRKPVLNKTKTAYLKDKDGKYVKSNITISCNDAFFASTELANSSESVDDFRYLIRNRGCAMTMLSAVLSYYAGNNQSINPHTVNMFLNEIEGYGTYGDVQWSNVKDIGINDVTFVAKVKRDIIYRSETETKTLQCRGESKTVKAVNETVPGEDLTQPEREKLKKTQPLTGMDKNIIDILLDRCKPIILKVYNYCSEHEHFVVAVDRVKDVDGNTVDYVIQDPGRGETRLSGYGVAYGYYYIDRADRKEACDR